MRTSRWVTVALIVAASIVAPAAAGATTTTTLLLPQSSAFVVLGHSCGGIQEQAFATRFRATDGAPVGDVYLQTRCGGSGRGGGYHTTTYSAWTHVIWNLSGVVRSYAVLPTPPAHVSPTFTAVDANGDVLHNVLYALYVPPANCTVGNTTYCTYRAYLTTP
jgi:hypothetical protein